MGNMDSNKQQVNTINKYSKTITKQQIQRRIHTMKLLKMWNSTLGHTNARRRNICSIELCDQCLKYIVPQKSQLGSRRTTQKCQATIEMKRIKQFVNSLDCPIDMFLLCIWMFLFLFSSLTLRILSDDRLGHRPFISAEHTNALQYFKIENMLSIFHSIHFFLFLSSKIKRKNYFMKRSSNSFPLIASNALLTLSLSSSLSLLHLFERNIH